VVWFRRLLWSALALVLVLAAVAAYLVATFDAQRHKATLIDWVAREHQRTLALGGPISLGVWPRLHVKLAKVALSEHQLPEVFASADELDLSVQTLPLMRGQLRVERVAASGVSLRYRRDEAGKSNIDDLLEHEPPEPKEATPGEPLRFEVAGIVLNRVALQVDDRKTGIQGDLQVAEFRSGRLADGVKTQVSVQASADLKQPRAAKVQVSGTLALTPDIAKGSVLLEDLVLDLVARTAGLDHGQGRLSLARLAYDPAGQALELAKLDLRAQTRRGLQTLNLELAWPELLVRGQQLKGSALTGRAALAGPMVVDAAFSTQAPQGSFKSITLPGLVVDFKVKGQGWPGQDGLVGQVKGSLSADSPQASDTRVASLGWSLEGQLNQSPFTTKGQARLSQPVPWVEASASFAALDLNRLMPAATTASASAASEPASGAASTAPAAGTAGDPVVDLTAFQSINGRFDVSAKQLAWRHYRVADAQIQASLDAGRLMLQNLSGAAWGGRFQAKGAAQSGPQQTVALQASAQGVNILALMKDVARKEVLEGTGEVRLDVTTGGQRVSQLTAGLNGTAAVVLRDGAVRGINLAKSLREARARLTGRANEVQKSNQAEETDFTEMSASFVIAQGVARNDDLQAKSPFLRVGGEGTVDLVKRRLDYTVKATVANTGKGQGGADLEALSGVTIPVALNGPWDALDWRISWADVAMGSIQNTLKNELEKKLGAGGEEGTRKSSEQIKGQVKDTLKGLFR
jgi:AsmA protein